MYISSQAAKNMASIIITETQGAETLARQQPLNVVDQDDRWLVYGKPYDFDEIGLNYCQFYIIFLKKSAEIVGLGSEGSLKINPSVKQYLLDAMNATDRQLKHAFGPRKFEQMDGFNLKRNLEFNEFLYGGLVNTSQGAIDYASHLIESSQSSLSKNVPELVAEERAGVWHINKSQKSEDKDAKPILSFDRLTGRVLSCVV